MYFPYNSDCHNLFNNIRAPRKGKRGYMTLLSALLFQISLGISALLTCIVCYIVHIITVRFK